MRHLLPFPVVFLLSGCGMKGDLYEAPPPAGPAESTEPAAEQATGDTDKGERKTIPSTPDPAKSE
jgi:predicted small lipoprotein YifL